MEHKDIFEYVKNEENAYQTTPIPVCSGWDWNMYSHVKRTDLYKNSQFEIDNDKDRPFFNITRPLLNLQYRAEGFNVKDIKLFVNEASKYFKSFLIRKYHDKWAREHDLDTFIDDMVESYVDYGGVLVKDVNEIRPEVVPLKRLAFCDQTDILGGAICEKHYYSPAELKKFSKNWDKEAIDYLIEKASSFKELPEGQQAQTPSRWIEVYELHGEFPEHWLGDDVDYDDYNYIGQMHVIGFYKDEKGINKGIHLYRGKEPVSPYKFLPRDSIFGRALGFGGGEELFEAQVWSNLSEIRMRQMLDTAAKTLFKTTDPAVAQRNNLSDMDDGQIIELMEGSDLSQVNTYPANLSAFEKTQDRWVSQAKLIASANESILGEQPKSGTPFALQQLVTAENHSLHEYRRGKLATFLGEIYRDWIIPWLAREVVNEQEFLASLDLEELQQVADTLVENRAKNIEKQMVLSGRLFSKEEREEMRNKIRDKFMRGDNKRFIKILKDEMKDAPIDIEVVIANKQKDIAQDIQNLTNIAREVMAAREALNDPRISKLYNEILEKVGLSPIDFHVPEEIRNTSIDPVQLQQQQVAKNTAKVSNQLA